MDHSSIRTQIPALVSAHVPRNVRSFKFRIYEDLPQDPRSASVWTRSPSRAKLSPRPIRSL